MKSLNNRSLYEIEKEQKIKSYISKDSYVPKINTIKFELNSELNSKTDPDKFTKGNIVRSDINSNSFFSPKEKSSATKFNKFQDYILNDSLHLYNKVCRLDDELEDSFRDMLNKSSKFLNEYSRLESQINRELISQADNEMFTYGITEDFSTNDKIILSSSDALVINGQATCKASEYIIPKDFNYILNATSRLRDRSSVSGSDITSIQNIVKKDGSYYQHVVTTKNQDEIVDFILDINLNTSIGVEVKSIRIDSLNLSKTSLAIYTADQPENWELGNEGLIVIAGNTTNYSIDKKSVRYIKVVLTKSEADSYIDGNYIYSFILDYVGLLDISYETKETTTLICGPYEIKDEENNPINFNYATIKSGTCCVIPDQTNIEFYLSKDMINWKHVSFWNQTTDVAVFGESLSDLFSLIDSDVASFIITDAALLRTYNLGCSNNEAILNFYIPANKMAFYKPNTASIKRATRNSPNGGWFVNGTEAKCKFFVNSLEGIYLTFKGNVILNNKSVTGKQYLSYGEHSLTINNYRTFTPIEIASVSNEGELNNLIAASYDRFLIEGFPYSSNFTGLKTLTGVSDNYGCEMLNTDKTYFVNNKENLEIFEEIKIDNVGYFFKINIPENRNSDEYFSINALSLDALSDNKLYIKALMTTKNANVSPKIDLIQVRVI